MRILNTVLLVLILLVAGSAAAYYYFSTSGRAAPAEQAFEPTRPVVPAPIFLALEPFTVTIQGERGSQILYTEITLRLNDSESHTTLVQYMPEVRNRVLAELARHTGAELQTTEGRDTLATRLKRVLSTSLHPHLNSPGISSVLFTAFVIQ